MLPLSGSALARRRSRGGELVSVLSKTDFIFDGRPGSPGGSVQVAPLAVGIDTEGWKSGMLIVRLHTISTPWSVTAVAKVQPLACALVPEDPSVVFSSGTVLSGGGGPAEVSITSSSTAGSLLTAGFNTGLAGQLMVQLVFEQGATAGSAQGFAISIDLVGRDR
jgi:hypothetical protein